MDVPIHTLRMHAGKYPMKAQKYCLNFKLVAPAKKLKALKGTNGQIRKRTQVLKPLSRKAQSRARITLYLLAICNVSSRKTYLPMKKLKSEPSQVPMKTVNTPTVMLFQCSPSYTTSMMKPVPIVINVPGNAMAVARAMMSPRVKTPICLFSLIHSISATTPDSN